MNDVGLIGLGVMGSNLILNIYDNFSKNISSFDIDSKKINDFSKKIEDKSSIKIFDSLEKFVYSIKTPRKIIIGNLTAPKAIPKSPPKNPIKEHKIKRVI